MPFLDKLKGALNKSKEIGQKGQKWINEQQSKAKLNTQIKAEKEARKLEEKAKYDKQLYERLQRQEKAQRQINKTKNLQEKIKENKRKEREKKMGGSPFGGSAFGGSFGPRPSVFETSTRKRKKPKSPFGMR